MEATSLRFARIARRLGDAARAQGLRAPTFRSPPRLPGVTRTIRRAGRGRATISVVLRGRPWAAVSADMIDGVVAANGLRGVAADRVRAALWSALADLADDQAA
ncbi:MAG TPA: hypothetical protein VIL48_01400 [Acidimicrobiales bacterium]